MVNGISMDNEDWLTVEEKRDYEICSLFKQSLYSYTGQGTLFSEDRKISTHVHFNCSQLFDGSIEGNIEMTRETFSLLKFDTLSFFIEGETDKGEKIFINKGVMYGGHIGTENYHRFTSLCVDVEKRALKQADSTIMLKYGVICIEPFKVQLDTQVGKLVFKKIQHFERAFEYIRGYGIPCLTSVADLIVKPEIKCNQPKDYIEATKEELWRILRLTTFAQGIYQNWMYCEVFKKIGEKFEIIHIQHRLPRKRLMKPVSLIPVLHLREFLAKTYSNYSNELDLKMGFLGGIEWYIEALSGGFIESKYILGFIGLEHLVDKFKKRSDRESILEEEAFESFYEELKKEARKILRKTKLNASKRSAIYSGLKGLNRYSFTSNLIELLRENKVGYSDLFNNLGIIAEIRNKIVHEGVAVLPFEEIYENYLKLMTLIQRILLSIIRYEGRIINWTKDFNVEQFNKDPNNEFQAS